MKITYFGGVNEIGGNKILLHDRDTRIFLDFGISYTKMNEYFEFPLLQPTNINDLLKTNVLPDLDGLYRYNKYEPVYGKRGPNDVIIRPEKKEIDGILISHAHMDHYGYIGLLREDIPIYLSKISKKIIELYSRTGRSSFNTKINHLSWCKLEYKNEYRINDLIIKRFDVDHSILGASSFFIQGKKNVVYTGDFRLHGLNRVLSEDFLEKIQNEKIDYLICEGTRLGQDKNQEDAIINEKILGSEEELEKKCIEIINSENDLIIYDASPADFKRIGILWKVAKKTGRTLIVDSKKAFLLLNLNKNETMVDDLPGINDFKILLGRSKLRSNTKVCRELTESCPDFYLECFKTGRQSHEREMLKEDDSISDDRFVWGPNLRKEILDHPNEYILYTSNGPLLLLHFKLRKEKIPGTYIYGKAEPFNEEMEFTFNRLLNWLDLCDLKLKFAHTSGHSHPEDLRKAVEIINPEHLIPIHTEFPELFEDIIPTDTNLIKPELNTTLNL